MQRVLRIAENFEEAERLDREDLAQLSFEERINAVTELRKVWFGESRVRSGLVRVLEFSDFASRAKALKKKRGSEASRG